MKTLPGRMMRHRATLTVPEGVTAWHAPEGGEATELSRVHVQRTRGVAVTGGFDADMDVKPDAELYYDCRLSHPRGIDWLTLMRQAEALDAFLAVSYGGEDYRVTYVDELPDDAGGVHHYRMELAGNA